MACSNQLGATIVERSSGRRTVGGVGRVREYECDRSRRGRVNTHILSLRNLKSQRAQTISLISIKATPATTLSFPCNLFIYIEGPYFPEHILRIDVVLCHSPLQWFNRSCASHAWLEQVAHISTQLGNSRSTEIMQCSTNTPRGAGRALEREREQGERREFGALGLRGGIWGVRTPAGPSAAAAMMRWLLMMIVAEVSRGVGAAPAATAATTWPPIVSEPLTTVVEVNEDPATLGPVFDGVGANSAGGGTRLLLDYPEHVRSDILDLLFKPQFGASLQHLKVEIGSDGDTTEGAEPTHARNHSDLSFDRGYEVWFLQQAAQRRPDMQLSGLLFGVPGWIRASPGGMWGAASVEYLVDWVSGLRSQKGLNITSLGVAYNERSYNSRYIKTIRKALDSAGFKTVKTIAPDSWARMWTIVKDMHNDPELAAAVDIIGTHCPGAVNGHPENQPPPSTMALGKPLWSTEQHIGEASGSNALRGGITASLPIWDWHAALMLARVLNQGYITANQTSTLIWTPTWSWSDYIWYAGKGLVVANTPWSGHYEVPDALWLVAHTTQAVQPGWRFVQPGTRMLADGLGSVCSYISPDGTNLSIVVETANSLVNNTLKLRLGGSLVHLRNLAVWRSVAGDVFKKQRALQLDNASATLVVLPGAVYTLTTTAGMQKGGENLTVPPSSNFSLPHFDSFESYQPLTMPRFTSDMHGSFTVDAGSRGKVLRQRTLLPPDCTHCGASTNYVTTMGDGSLIDYSLRVSGRLLPADTAVAGTAVGYLYIASHIGVKQEYPEVKTGNLTAEGCSISKGTGQICRPPYCSVPMCSLGKQGFAPSSLHSSLTIPGFILQLSWNGSGWNGARWTVHAGAGDCGQLRPFGECPSRTVANGSLPDVAVGSWVDLELTAQRGATSRDSTTLTTAVNGQHLGTWAVAQVSEARGAIALGNSMTIPVSEWDNLSLTLAQDGSRPLSLLPAFG
eukprot:COSAG02_NODE_3926_length_6036_cov_4.060805_1_plen_964_part_00